MNELLIISAHTSDDLEILKHTVTCKQLLTPQEFDRAIDRLGRLTFKDLNSPEEALAIYKLWLALVRAQAALKELQELKSDN